MITYQTAPTPTWAEPLHLPTEDGVRVLLTDKEPDGLVTLDGELVPGAERWCATRVAAHRVARR